MHAAVHFTTTRVTVIFFAFHYYAKLITWMIGCVYFINFSASALRWEESRTDSHMLMRIFGVFPHLINMVEKKNERNVLLCFPAYCLSFGRQGTWPREQIYSKAHRWNNAVMKAESQFGTQRWLADKFRSFQACVGNSCAHIKRVSLVNFLRFCGSRGVCLCAAVRMIAAPAPCCLGQRDQSGVEKLKCKTVCSRAREGVWGPDAIVMRLMGYHILGHRL